MKKRVASMWVHALRSEKYTQCSEDLKIVLEDGSASHCCLGVLCELYNKSMKRKGKRPLSQSAEGWAGAQKFDGQSQILPDKVMKWSGLKDSAGEFKTSGGSECLAMMNDDGKTFRQIALVIERNVERL